MVQPISKADLKVMFRELRADMRHKHDGIRSEIRENTRDILGYINKKISPVGEQIGEINTKLEAIMSGEILVTRSQFLNLVRQLKSQGIKLEEDKLFTIDA